MPKFFRQIKVILFTEEHNNTEKNQSSTDGLLHQTPRLRRQGEVFKQTASDKLNCEFYSINTCTCTHRTQSSFNHVTYGQYENVKKRNVQQLEDGFVVLILNLVLLLQVQIPSAKLDIFSTKLHNSLG